MKFTKAHGYGNDYIVIDETDLPKEIALDDLVRSMCDRHRGVGGDGVALLGKAESDADFSLRIFNVDGGEAAMSGNGSRCAVAYLYYNKIWTSETLRLSTQAGIKVYTLIEKRGKEFRFKAEMGKPAFNSTTIPMKLDPPREKVIDYKLSLNGTDVTFTSLQMCNPNVCVFVEDFDELDYRSIGDQIEHHELFPLRTNVEFIKVVDRSRIQARIWERGVGETSSSGTGGSAAAIASMINGFTDRQVVVETPGGNLEVEWRGDDEVLLTGNAEIIYTGDYIR
jgi:diaminopimelate epimerase